MFVQLSKGIVATLPLKKSISSSSPPKSTVSNYGACQFLTFGCFTLALHPEEKHRALLLSAIYSSHLITFPSNSSSASGEKLSLQLSFFRSRLVSVSITLHHRGQRRKPSEIFPLDYLWPLWPHPHIPLRFKPGLPFNVRILLSPVFIQVSSRPKSWRPESPQNV
jgi:hypothetical protein